MENAAIESVYKKLHSELWNAYFNVVRTQMMAFFSISRDVTKFQSKQSYTMRNIVIVSSLLLKLSTKIGIRLVVRHFVFFDRISCLRFPPSYTKIIHFDQYCHLSYWVKTVYEFYFYKEAGSCFFFQSQCWYLWVIFIYGINK